MILLAQIGSALMGLYVFVLACFAGYQLITKVPPILHTPLTSGSNAISGVTLLGAMTVAQILPTTGWSIATIVAVVAVALAQINVVGGFMVTHRMLNMFGKKRD